MNKFHGCVVIYNNYKHGKHNQIICGVYAIKGPVTR